MLRKPIMYTKMKTSKKMFSKVEDIRNATKIKWPEVNPDNQYVAIYDYKELIAYGVFDIDCDTYHNYGLKAGCKKYENI